MIQTAPHCPAAPYGLPALRVSLLYENLPSMTIFLTLIAFFFLASCAAVHRPPTNLASIQADA